MFRRYDELNFARRCASSLSTRKDAVVNSKKLSKEQRVTLDLILWIATAKRTLDVAFQFSTAMDRQGFGLAGFGNIALFRCAPLGCATHPRDALTMLSPTATYSEARMPIAKSPHSACQLSDAHKVAAQSGRCDRRVIQCVRSCA